MDKLYKIRQFYLSFFTETVTDDNVNGQENASSDRNVLIAFFKDQLVKIEEDYTTKINSLTTKIDNLEKIKENYATTINELTSRVDSLEKNIEDLQTKYVEKQEPILTFGNHINVPTVLGTLQIISDEHNAENIGAANFSLPATSNFNPAETLFNKTDGHVFNQAKPSYIVAETDDDESIDDDDFHDVDSVSTITYPASFNKALYKWSRKHVRKVKKQALQRKTLNRLYNQSTNTDMVFCGSYYGRTSTPKSPEAPTLSYYGPSPRPINIDTISSEVNFNSIYLLPSP